MKSNSRAVSSESAYSAKELRQIFNQMDTNEDGGLGLFEIKNALKKLDAEMPVHLAYSALCYADRNRDGKLGEEEIDQFVKYMMSKGYVV
ncbi:putative calcium-binding protein CML10 [Cucumis melo var. makuwa]|uniref:Calcium-binding protein CML10 n=2 Tax=Cucumis melo TaxID=3656 RepID=A0A5D3D9N2_CUCMM|nr:putative calcium-binding protein CML10 [Cucumis melo var. makuwa]TYK20209.1 putative calcium-binding protein CML10 [Cucumis melo var. makuwa]